MSRLFFCSEQPVETQDSVYLGTLNLLEAIRSTGKAIKLYNASSSECSGDLGGQPATEQTAFRPRSSYAVAYRCIGDTAAAGILPL
jgi:GDPmannose 4,6-dehydratase